MRFVRSLWAPENRPIFLYLSVTIALTAVALGFWLTGFSKRHADVARFVYFEPSAPGSDMTVDKRFLPWREKGAYVLQRPRHKELFNFCPFAFFVIIFFLSFSTHAILANTIATLTGALIAALLLAWALRSHLWALTAVLVAACTSYPFAFACERGNIEGMVWIPCAVGIFFFCRRNYWAASLALALAASIKPFPALLFLLFLPKRLYKQLCLGVAVSIAISLVSLEILGPSLSTAFQENLRGFELVTEQFALRYRYTEVAVDHSLFSFLKQVIRALAGWPRQEELTFLIHRVYPYYVGFAVLLTAFSIFRLRKMPGLNWLFAVSVLMILVSPVNNDYTLIAIYIPWAILLLNLARSEPGIPRFAASWIMVCCAVLFTSQYYLVFGEVAACGAQVKTVALAGILILSLVYPMPTPSLDGCPEVSERAVNVEDAAPAL